MGALIKKYKIQVATLEYNEKWLRTKAEKVNLNRFQEKKLVKDLSRIMSYLRSRDNWVGSSSNNIYWNGTEKPIKVIKVPHPETNIHLTLVNPQIIKKSDDYFYSLEGCAAFPETAFRVKRAKNVKVKANILKGFKYFKVELEYKLENSEPNRLPAVSIVQHECDHLEGKLLSDYNSNRF